MEYRSDLPSGIERHRGKTNSAKGKEPWMDASVWFAVDCSIPPDAQLASIEFIADQYAKEMRLGELTSSAFYSEEPEVKPIKNHPLYAELSLRQGFAAVDEDPNNPTVWRLVRV